MNANRNSQSGVGEMDSITFVCPHLGKGGAERVMSILIRNYVKIGWRVQLILLYEDFIEYPIPDAVEKVFLNLSRRHTPLTLLSRWKKIRAAVTGDVVVAFLYSAIRDTAFSMTGADKKLIISDRSDPANEPPGKIQQFARTLSYYFVDRIVFQTQDAKDYFPRAIQKKGVIIPNPVSSGLPEANPEDAEKIIVAAGRLEPQKNFPLLIRSFAKLSAEFPDYRLQIYGRGYLEEELKDLTHTLKIADKVDFPGFVTDIHERMRRASVYVSSSDYEGISNSMLEAMAMGVPTICTDCPVGGARETITDGVNGILFPVGDEEALYRAMKKILSDKAFAQTLSANSMRIKDSLSEEAIFERWLSVSKG